MQTYSSLISASSAQRPSNPPSKPASSNISPFSYAGRTCLRSHACKALGQVQIERPAYVSGAPEWWGEVIRRTALGAGADPTRKDTLFGLSDSGRGPRTRTDDHPHHAVPAIVRSSAPADHLCPIRFPESSCGSFDGCDHTYLAQQVLLRRGVRLV